MADGWVNCNDGRVTAYPTVCDPGIVVLHISNHVSDFIADLLPSQAMELAALLIESAEAANSLVEYDKKTRG